jgi:hypothetical protein
MRESRIDKPISKIPDRFHMMGPLTTTLAYEEIDNIVTRVFWVISHDYLDGCDESPTKGKKFLIVDPASVGSGQASKPYEPAGKTYGLLSRKPSRLISRWEAHSARHPPRVLNRPGRLRKLLTSFKSLFGK